MGYSVEVQGRVRLAAAADGALPAIRTAMLAGYGWLTEDEPVGSFADLGPFACAAIAVDDGWLHFVPLGPEHDSKWSEQTTVFYRALAPWAEEGELAARGDDGKTWSYRYRGGAVVQIGRNAYDGAPWVATDEEAWAILGEAGGTPPA